MGFAQGGPVRLRVDQGGAVGGPAERAVGGDPGGGQVGGGLGRLAAGLLGLLAVVLVAAGGRHRLGEVIGEVGRAGPRRRGGLVLRVGLAGNGG